MRRDQVAGGNSASRPDHATANSRASDPASAPDRHDVLGGHAREPRLTRWQPRFRPPLPPPRAKMLVLSWIASPSRHWTSDGYRALVQSMEPLGLCGLVDGWQGLSQVGRFPARCNASFVMGPSGLSGGCRGVPRRQPGVGAAKGRDGSGACWKCASGPSRFSRSRRPSGLPADKPTRWTTACSRARRCCRSSRSTRAGA